MHWLTPAEVAERFQHKRVAIVGSGPSCALNPLGFVDSHDIVVRVNNFKLSPGAGQRTDVHYSFYGHSIKKTADELIRSGVRLCMCKCPDAKVMDSAWHARNGYDSGVDFRWIYQQRRGFWPCPVYVPTLDSFLAKFELLGGRIPTTGFSAILEIAEFDCDIYLTGFDFFDSGLHNVDQPWRPGRPDDPIGHAPDRERAWLLRHRDRFQMDEVLCTSIRGGSTRTISAREMQRGTSRRLRRNSAAARGST